MTNSEVSTIIEALKQFANPEVLAQLGQALSSVTNTEAPATPIEQAFANVTPTTVPDGKTEIDDNDIDASVRNILDDIIHFNEDDVKDSINTEVEELLDDAGWIEENDKYDLVFDKLKSAVIEKLITNVEIRLEEFKEILEKCKE
ncbi:MAG: hypothetical protein HUJ61_00205 [Bacilli bacterium]|nr:hypothetical protein [Bacilli bacterium]